MLHDKHVTTNCEASTKASQLHAQLYQPSTVQMHELTRVNARQQRDMMLDILTNYLYITMLPLGRL